MPQFSRTIWHVDNRKDLLANWDMFHTLNNVMYHELRALSEGRHIQYPDRAIPASPPITRDDIVLFPTILQYQLLGVVRWFNSLEEERRPKVLCYLMGPSGGAFDDDHNIFRIWSIDTARFYKLAFRDADRGAPGIEFFCCGETHAEQYSLLRGKKVSPYPLLNSALRPDAPLREKPRKQVLLYAGGPRAEKGSLLLADLIRKLCPAFPEWTFKVQIAWNHEHAAQKRLGPELRPLDDQFENLDLILGYQGDDDYFRMFDESDVVTMAYCPKWYAHSSSGLAWEAIATANTLVVPQSTWLERESKRLGAGYLTFEEQTADSIADAVSKAITAPPLARPERLAAARRFKEDNRIDMLEKQIFDHWLADAEPALA